MRENIFQNLKIQKLGNINTNLANGTSAWFHVSDFPHFSLLVELGTVADALTFTLNQAQDSSGTGAKALQTAAAITFLATDDDTGKILEVETRKGLDINNGFDYVAVVISGVATTNTAYQALLFQMGRHRPVTQPTALTEVAKVAG